MKAQISIILFIIVADKEVCRKSLKYLGGNYYGFENKIRTFRGHVRS